MVPNVLIEPTVIARTPRHLGVNVEIQEHYDRTNLWDWLADSGSTIAREFHPEQTLRVRPIEPETWKDITTPADFQRFRERVTADPNGDAIQWGAYSFESRAHWMGVPDGIIEKVIQAGVDPLVSLGYWTKMFPRPLVKDLHFVGIAGDDLIDWSAAASAYDYYFAVIYHYASQLGARYFTMINEPECHGQEYWHYPPQMLALGENPYFSGTPEQRRAAMQVLSTQWAAMARFARDAMEDVRGLLQRAGKPAELFLSGPTSGNWEPFWEKGGQFMDACDFHHYHVNAAAYPRVYSRVALRSAAKAKRTCTTEFNRRAGSLQISEMCFSIQPSLELAALIMEALDAPRPDGPACEFLALYLLHFPATHRNYKSLLYGDMNSVDWSGLDRGMRNLPDEWYPTFEELEVRHATHGYHMFRMLARCTPGRDPGAEPYDVLQTSMVCLIDDGCGTRVLAGLRIMAVDQGERMVISILNPAAGGAPGVEIDLRFFPGRFTTAVIRETSMRRADEVVAQENIDDTRLAVDISGQSLTQVILTRPALDRIKSLRLAERTTTPGSANGLSLHQTTRLQALASLDGREIDVTDTNVIWSSSAPDIVRVYQGGLVQRIRNSARPAAISARTLTGVEAEEIVIPGI